mgnify:CR=1 FL=1
MHIFSMSNEDKPELLVMESTDGESSTKPHSRQMYHLHVHHQNMRAQLYVIGTQNIRIYQNMNTTDDHSLTIEIMSL